VTTVIVHLSLSLSLTHTFLSVGRVSLCWFSSAHEFSVFSLSCSRPNRERPKAMHYLLRTFGSIHPKDKRNEVVPVLN
jgi:hypothetical protein